MPATPPKNFPGRPRDATGDPQREYLLHARSPALAGQQHRAAIARGLAKQPKVLLADEPTGNLDEGTRDEIITLLADIWRQRGLTMVMVTHDSAAAQRAGRA